MFVHFLEFAARLGGGDLRGDGFRRAADERQERRGVPGGRPPGLLDVRGAERCGHLSRSLC